MVKKQYEKVIFSFRIEKETLAKIEDIADIFHISKQKVINDILKKYVDDKITNNKFLPFFLNCTIEIPINNFFTEFISTEKFHQKINLLESFNNKRYKNFFLKSYNEYLKKNLKTDELKDINYIDNILCQYKILKICNNLDNITTYCLNDSDNITDHIISICTDDNVINTGIEFYIDTDYNKNNLLCFYFVLFESELTISIITFKEAIKIIKSRKKIELLNKANSLHKELKEAKNDKDIKKIAKKYNTGNIIKLNKY